MLSCVNRLFGMSFGIIALMSAVAPDSDASTSGIGMAQSRVAPTTHAEALIDHMRFAERSKTMALATGALSGIADSGTTPAEEKSATGMRSRKSVFKAAALSLVLPGAGQFYNGSHWAKTGAFVAVEATLIAQTLHYDNEGDDQVVEFENYANAYWSQSEYWEHLNSVYGVTDDTCAACTHHLPDTKTQQYYEMIGKYNQFSYGWAGDTAIVYGQEHRFEINPYPSPRREIYNTMRADANKTFQKRDNYLIGAVANHVLSAIDAALAARNLNKKITVGDRLTVTPRVRLARDRTLAANVNLRWRF